MTIKPLFNEQILLSDIAKGDQRAFKLIYDHYYDNVYAYALHVIKSELLAEELVQECYLKLWVKGGEAAEINNLESYLITMVRNRALDMLRRLKLEKRVSGESKLQWKEEHNETEEGIFLNEGRRILQKGVDQLPSQQKLVYQLCYQSGKKYEEVARELNLSPETVKSYMKLALKNLRDFITKNSDLAILAVLFRLF